ncbi:MAG: prolyl oligopeptidase family serine peptidase [Pseudomonadota bacterium]
MSSNQHHAPAGTWQSPLTAETLAGASIRLAQPCLDGDRTYWLEGRPTEKGRTVLVMRDADGRVRDLTPEPYDVRSQVHEYGGSAYLVDRDDIFFVNARDQGIYRIDRRGIHCVFQQDDQRFANFCLDRTHGRLIAVGEAHVGDKEPINQLVSVSLSDGTLSVLHEGADFYSSPTLNADDSSLAFLTWMHPNMPWDSTTLHVADVTAQGLSAVRIIEQGYAAFSPQFGPDGQLYFVSDRDNFWNLYTTDETGSRAVTQLDAELGMPHWIFGMSTYGFLDADTAIGVASRDGLWHLCRIDLRSSTVTFVDPWLWTAVDHLAVTAEGIVCHAARPDHVDSIIRLKHDDLKHVQVLRKASDFALDDSMISRAKAITFGEGQSTAYGFYYAPQHSTTKLPAGDAPPLIVLVHGGPTTATGNGLNARIQFWTTRGFAVLDVNYRGSTGFGRRYRHLLQGQWGQFDVEDCIQGAQYLIDQNLAHADRVFIMGGSAGGYTVLSALAFTDFFSGGVSSYGIGDLALLVNDTHKFEARYLDSLVAPFDAELYRARSPLYAADQIRVPVLFFQGTEDKMVPLNQAETMVDALKQNGVPVGLEIMVGEGHGFRRDDSIIRLMNLTLAFFLKIMGHRSPSTDALSLHNDTV